MLGEILPMPPNFFLKPVAGCGNAYIKQTPMEVNDASLTTFKKHPHAGYESAGYFGRGMRFPRVCSVVEDQQWAKCRRPTSHGKPQDA
jgi:ATP-dependent DNA ligase